MFYLLLQVISICLSITVFMYVTGNIVFKIYLKSLRKEYESNINKVSDEILKRVREELNKSLDESL
ncbi:TPA: hypothetical protein ACG3PC_003759 [Clostridioides difficile]|uniref:hypothetical protein n=1 Tax=Clostridioides difficile TaxID=1496 RepID=UPI0005E77ED0|nr:hypothetical protein [Clostridioides difficile]KJF65011.1 hypothetical protein TZ54_02730 [Clostridioides difficile]MBY2552351.1 hypothetical protein [Clostridioides difficile]MCK3746460.1 hypothetical protein [Clostridioides difficile]MCP8396592.1 hypothetical protein [Clostridioides difficile]MCP8416327.1 hypothetical protein [Clostridioides difficile]